MKATKNIITETWSIVEEKMVPLGQTFLSITINDFRDEQECDLMLKKVQQLVKESKGRVKVF